MYADDTSFDTLQKIVDEYGNVLQANIIKISKWCQVNNLIINDQQTKCINSLILLI